MHDFGYSNHLVLIACLVSFENNVGVKRNISKLHVVGCEESSPNHLGKVSLIMPASCGRKAIKSPKYYNKNREGLHLQQSLHNFDIALAMNKLLYHRLNTREMTLTH